MIRISKNQAVGTRRRVYFHLVSSTDGMTPAVGEDGGQPQVSVDGGAWTNVGIGTLVQIGYGRYYAELTQAIVNVDYAQIETRYKSANTAECPGSTAVVDKTVEDAGATYTRIGVPLGASLSADIALIDDFLDTEVTAILSAVDTEVAAIKAKTDNLPAAPAAVSDIPSASTNAAAVRTNLTTELARIDATISSRNATTPPTLAQIEASTIIAKKADTDTLLSRLSAGRATLMDNLSSLDAAITSRLATVAYTAPDNTSITTIKNAVDTEVAAIKAKTDNLPVAPAAVSDIPTAPTIAAAVWASGTRTLSSFGSLVTDMWANTTRTLSSQSDSPGTTALLSRIASVLDITGGKVDINDKTGFSGTATNMIAPAPTSASNAAAVRSELSAELGRLDVAVSSRNDTTPPTVAAIRSEMDANSVKLASAATAANVASSQGVVLNALSSLGVVSRVTATLPQSIVRASAGSSSHHVRVQLTDVDGVNFEPADYNATLQDPVLHNGFGIEASDDEGNMVVLYADSALTTPLTVVTECHHSSGVPPQVLPYIGGTGLREFYIDKSATASLTNINCLFAWWDKGRWEPSFTIANHKQEMKQTSLVADIGIGSVLADTQSLLSVVNNIHDMDLPSVKTVVDNIAIKPEAPSVTEIRSEIDLNSTTLSSISTELGDKPTLAQIEASAILAKKADTDTLITRLSSARAGLLDNLSNLDTLISSRLATASYTAPDNVSIATVRSAVDTEITTIISLLDTEISAIKTKTDALPSNTTQEFANVMSAVNSVSVDVDTSAIPGAVWTHPDRGLTQAIDVAVEVDGEMLAEPIVDGVMSRMSLSATLSPGPGTGSVLFEDYLTGVNNTSIVNALVRVFEYTDGHADFSKLKGSCATSSTGAYHFHLDPGTYARRVWKNGTVVLDDLIVIPDQTV